jgi:predicted nucleic acid-binding protein
LGALERFEKYADQNVSFTDCVSFVLMQKHGIRTAFSFDRHFAMAGFDVEP